MARTFDLLVFDWDGTLLDSASAIVAAVRAACRDLGYREPSPEHARQAIGLGLAEALRHSVPELRADEYAPLVERYRHHYLACDHELALFDGVFELIEQLHAADFLLAVATGKSRHGLERALDHSGLKTYFMGSRCADECFSKPHPQMLEELMDEFAVPRERTLMIGDTTHDLQMAINAGVSALAVDYGAHTAQALDGLAPLARLSSVADLAGWLQRNA